MTTPIKGLLAGLIFFAAALLPVLAGPAEAANFDRTEAILSSAEAGDLAPEAQGRKKKEKNGGLLDDIGLGSLDEIPWGAFGLGMVLSALVGAGGGFIYAGIAEPREKAEP
jgi:hypothetical protein